MNFLVPAFLLTILSTRALATSGYWHPLSAVSATARGRINADPANDVRVTPPTEQKDDDGSSTDGVPMQLSRPLTKKLCLSRGYRKLRTCKMAIEQEQAMAHKSHQFLCINKDRWEQDDYDYDDRKKRSITKRQVRRRQRVVNGCSGTAVKKVILQAYEAENPTIKRELLHDPENFLYQTHFVETCRSFRTTPYGYACRMHKIRFKAAVWSTDPNSDDISVIDVITHGYCALSRLI